MTWSTVPIEAVAAWLVRTSWQAVVLIAMVAAVQLAFGRWLAPRWRYALWMLVVVRLLMPVLPESPWSVFNVDFPQGAGAAHDTAGSAKPQAAAGMTITVVKTFDGDFEPASVYSTGPAPAPAPAPFDWRRAVVAIWLAGAILLVLRLVVAHVLLTRRLRPAAAIDPGVLALLDDCRRAMRVRGNVRAIATDAVGGPALYGVLRPRLLVPPAMLRELDRHDLRFVFLHELAHLKRHDTLTNVPLTLAAALHWFNPAVWFALSRCRTERELACDAMVLDATDADGSTAPHGYGHTMLRLAEALRAPGRRSTAAAPAVLGMLPGRSQLNRRITMISTFRRRRRRSSRWSVLPALLLVSVASCALTDKPSADAPATGSTADSSLKSPTPGAEASSAAQKPTPAGSKPATPAPVASDHTQGTDAETQRMNQLLDRRFPQLTFEAKPFEEVIKYLRETTDTNIVVNWRALEAAGVDRAAPVTARLKDVKFAKALDTVLADVGGGTVRFGYVVDDGVITVSTQDDLNRHVLTKVYDIRDLTVEVPDYERPPATGAAADARGHPTTQPKESLIEQITLLIQETIEPEAWRENGGSVGSIRPLSGQLIITASPQMHAGIATLLHQLREGRGMQIAVETRFLAIDPTLLDKALGERLKSTMGKSGEATVWQLSDEEVQAVLRAAQASKQSTLVTAPRITVFNGQRAFVNVATQNAYVAGFTVVKKEGGETRYEPKIDVIQSGIQLDVGATASADRSQAVLTLKPRISRLEGLTPAPYMGLKDLVVQVPQLVVHELQTTLSIPDRGTALIGGFVQSLNTGAANAGELVGQPGPAEVEVKRGQHVINKMPPSHNLYLLVKPTLIITGSEPPK